MRSEKKQGCGSEKTKEKGKWEEAEEGERGLLPLNPSFVLSFPPLLLPILLSLSGRVSRNVECIPLDCILLCRILTVRGRGGHNQRVLMAGCVDDLAQRGLSADDGIGNPRVADNLFHLGALFRVDLEHAPNNVPALPRELPQDPPGSRNNLSPLRRLGALGLRSLLRLTVGATALPFPSTTILTIRTGRVRIGRAEFELAEADSRFGFEEKVLRIVSG